MDDSSRRRRWWASRTRPHVMRAWCRCAIPCRSSCTCRARPIVRATRRAFAPFTEQPGDLPRPDTLAPYESLREHATGLIRVLDDQSAASGAWNPQLTPQQLRHGLEMMLRVRHFDARMMAMHRQGRISFHVTSRGEEASAVAGAMAYAHRDMLFPSYRQPGLMLVRGMPMVAMMCQIIGNRFDHTQGPADAGALQLAGRQRGVDLEPRRHAVAAGGRRGDGVRLSRRAARGRRLERRRHGGAGRLPPRAQFRVGLSPAVRAARGRQSMGDQHASQSIATGGRTFAARADAYRLPGLRVDGNDFLAVYAAEQWAIERARRGGGPIADRTRHLSLRRPFHERRHQPVPGRR